MSKRIVIPQNQLPNLTTETDNDGNVTYYISVRYRIISEDKNRTSAWTPNFRTEIETPYYNNISGLSDGTDNLYLSLIL